MAPATGDPELPSTSCPTMRAVDGFCGPAGGGGGFCAASTAVMRGTRASDEIRAMGMLQILPPLCKRAYAESAIPL